MQHIRAHVLVCGGTGCKSAGSKEVQLEFAKQLEQKGLSDEVMIVETGCHGFCEHGPLVINYLPGRYFLLPRKTGRCGRNCRKPSV